MEIEETAEHFALQENKRLCLQLDYLRIISHLIQAGIITQQENAQIKAKYVDNAKEMQGLYSRLLQLNSKASFDAFLDAVNLLGEIALAQKLLRDQISFGIPMLAVLDKIFSFLGQPDLSRSRLVCRKWNAVIASSLTNKFTAKFRPHSGHQQMIDFVSTAPKSFFCKRITRFSLDIRTMEPAAWVFYKTFFVEFGPQIQSLQLGENLNRDLLEFIFSLEILSYVANLKNLEVTTIHDLGCIPNDSISSLSGLETLALTEVNPRKSELFMRFLEKLLENDHKLKSLRLGFNSDYSNGIPNASIILPNMFKTSTLGNLAINGINDLNDRAFELMTLPNGGGRLKTFECTLEIVSAGIFRDFLASHQQTLRQVSITICGNGPQLIEVLPRLECLEYLNLTSIMMRRAGSFISNLQFCTQAPNLKCLIISTMGYYQTISGQDPQPIFVHTELRELSLGCAFNSSADGFLEFSSRISHCFPNLTNMKVIGLNAELPLPNQIGQLQLQPRSGHDYLDVWKSTHAVQSYKKIELSHFEQM